MPGSVGLWSWIRESWSSREITGEPLNSRSRILAPNRREITGVDCIRKVYKTLCDMSQNSISILPRDTRLFFKSQNMSARSLAMNKRCNMLHLLQFPHLAIAVSPRLEVESSGHAWLDGCNFHQRVNQRVNISLGSMLERFHTTIKGGSFWDLSFEKRRFLPSSCISQFVIMEIMHIQTLQTENRTF